MEDVLFTVSEVAKLLKVNVDSVHRLRKAGLLPFMKLGSYKLRKQALLDFLEKYEGKNIDEIISVSK